MARKTDAGLSYHRKGCVFASCEDLRNLVTGVRKPYAQIKTDALERLEKWITAQEARRRRMVGYIALHEQWRVNIGVSSHGFWGEGKTLAEAIHAALDRAERPKP